MQYYPFSVAVGASHHVLAKGNFIRYMEALTGTANPTLKVKPMGAGGSGSSEFLLRPGQSIKLPVAVPGFMIENFDGIATITGRLLVGEGDFNDAQISGSVSVSGIVDVDSAVATQLNETTQTVGTSLVNIYGGGPNRFRAAVRADASNTASVWVGSGVATPANAAIELAPGEMWIGTIEANAAIYAISTVAGQKTRVGYAT